MRVQLLDYGNSRFVSYITHEVADRHECESVQGAHDGELQNDGVSRIENEIFSFSKYYH
jgi:hypothetical protein